MIGTTQTKERGMVSTWRNEKSDDEKCPECGSVYEVNVQRLPARDNDRFKCEVCGHVIRTWNSTHSWDYKLKERGEGPK